MVTDEPDIGDDKELLREALYEVADEYREADEKEKAGATVKKNLRGEYLALMTEVVREEVPLAQLRITVSSDQDPREWVAQQYPTYTVESVQPVFKESDTGVELTHYLVVIQENPDLKKYEFVHDGYKFGRTLETPAPTFDAERFYNDFMKDPSWKHLTDLIEVETVTTYTLNETKASALMAEYPKVKDIFEQYVEKGVPKIKLLPIKAIQEEE